MVKGMVKAMFRQLKLQPKKQENERSSNFI